MTFSIVIPVYNTDQYLQECLDSVFVINHFNDEVICINDGSTDSCGQILDNYKKKYSNLRVFNQTNLGLSEARNVGLRNATGEYIIFLDSDDYLLPNSILAITQSLVANQCDVLIGNTSRDNKANGNSIANIISTPMSGSVALYNLMRKGVYSPMPWLYICKRCFLLDNMLFFEKGMYFEDEIWTVKMLLRAKSVIGLNYEHYFYRCNPSSITQTPMNPSKLDSKYRVVNELKALALESKQPVRDHIASRAYYIYNSLSDKTKNSSLFNKEFGELWNLHLTYECFCSCLWYLYPNEKHKRRFYRGFYLVSKIIKALCKRICSPFVELLRNLYKLSNRLKLKNRDFSLIANDCNGAFIIHDLGLRFNTPTINLYIPPEDFVRFVNDIKYYISIEQIDFLPKTVANYPIGMLGDVRIEFAHYHSQSEAQKKWNERKARINLDNVYYLLTAHDNCSEETLRSFDKLNCKHKLILSYKKHLNIESIYCIPAESDEVCLYEYPTKWSIKRHLDRFNFVSWFNNITD